jgi:hypothetical protein
LDILIADAKLHGRDCRSGKGFFCVIIVLIVYSYVIYQGYTVDGKEPLSPPFENRDSA